MDCHRPTDAPEHLASAHSYRALLCVSPGIQFRAARERLAALDVFLLLPVDSVDQSVFRIRSAASVEESGSSFWNGLHSQTPARVGALRAGRRLAETARF